MGYSARRFGILFHANVLTSGKETILGADVHESLENPNICTRASHALSSSYVTTSIVTFAPNGIKQNGQRSFTISLHRSTIQKVTI